MAQCITEGADRLRELLNNPLINVPLSPLPMQLVNPITSLPSMNALPFIPPGLEAMNVLPFPGSPPFEMPWIVSSIEIPGPGQIISGRYSNIPPAGKSGIYEFPDAKNPGQWYVGQTTNLRSRFHTHVNDGRLVEPETFVWTEIPYSSSSRQLEIAEYIRVNQLRQMGEHVSNVHGIIAQSLRDRIPEYVDRLSDQGVWPKWLKL